MRPHERCGCSKTVEMAHGKSEFATECVNNLNDRKQLARKMDDAHALGLYRAATAELPSWRFTPRSEKSVRTRRLPNANTCSCLVYRLARPKGKGLICPTTRATEIGPSGQRADNATELGDVDGGPGEDYSFLCKSSFAVPGMRLGPDDRPLSRKSTASLAVSVRLVALEKSEGDRVIFRAGSYPIRSRFSKGEQL
ncbi:hypothetical protein JTE90_019394 [Oedothorax gibbosus]|uniref:Uncharacterized protein n=1 Tax=Oedothorax gibbosus TaxID=931172 RepID=A0AAV6TJ26_9ARAC|nr:hypothetical protein JTE90_019394 [Oedothorax gibbosus]